MESTKALLLAAALMALAGPAVSQRQCSSGGLLCADCTSLVLCVSTSAGFEQVDVAACADDAPCSQSELRCSDKTSFCTNGLQGFQCADVGRYPDPYDCNLFYDCGPRPGGGGDRDLAERYDPAASQVCPSGKAYNPGSGVCDLPSTHAICTTDPPVPECNEDGSFSAGPLPLNASVYYICLSRRHQLYSCQDHTVFDPATISCQAPGSTTTTSTTTATSTTTSTTPEPQPTPYTCPGFGFYQYQDDCYKYIDCNEINHPRVASCDYLYYFDRDLRKCKRGSCPYH